MFDNVRNQSGMISPASMMHNQLDHIVLLQEVSFMQLIT